MSKKMTCSEAKKAMHENGLNAMEKAVIMIEADSKINCPVLTGTLKRSLTHDVIEDNNKIIGVVGSNVSYAYWAEKKKSYLEPSVNKNMPSIQTMFEQELKKV